MFFLKKKIEKKSYDSKKEKPVLRCSICTGEQTAGFLEKETGHFKEVMLILNEDDLKSFKEMYNIAEKIEKIY